MSFTDIFPRSSRELLLYLKYILKLIFKGFLINRCLIFKVRCSPLSCGVLDYITKSLPLCQHLFSIFFTLLLNSSVCSVVLLLFLLFISAEITTYCSVDLCRIYVLLYNKFNNDYKKTLYYVVFALDLMRPVAI